MPIVVVLTGLLAALALAGCATTKAAPKAKPTLKAFASGHANGRYADTFIASAKGAAHGRIAEIIVNAHTSPPNRKLDVEWSVACRKRGGGIGSRSGAFHAAGSLRRRLPLFADSSECYADASAAARFVLTGGASASRTNWGGVFVTLEDRAN